MNGNVSTVFVSYSHDDAEWARKLFEDAVRTTRGITVHSIDYKVLDPGVEFDEKLFSEIKDADGFIFLVSNSFLRSEYVQAKEWKWIEQSKAANRVCCIEIGRALSGKQSDSGLCEYLKSIHRDMSARLPKTIPKSDDDLKAKVAAVHRSIARMLDPEGMRLVDRLEERGLKDIEFLAHGRTGNVYLASTPTFGNKLAIKVPLEGAADRFLTSLTSAEEMSRIPNVVGIYEMDTTTTPFYCITEFIEGRTLASVIERARRENRPIPIEIVRNVLLKLSLAMRYAHANNMSHLNIRPNNILIDNHDEPFLLPTGRARDALSRQWSREALVAMKPGEFNNAPPEFFKGTGWDDQSADIYALGLIGYWLIAGEPADLVANREELETDSDAVPNFILPTDLMNLRPDCPVSLARTVMRMLNPEPTHRYASFDDLLPGLMRLPDANLATAELSWRRCLKSGEDIFQQFYERFFASAKSAENLFEKPWPTPRQKNLLRDAVVNLFHFYELKQTFRVIPASLNPLEGLAEQHAGRNIEKPHFQAFADALIDTIVAIDPDTDGTLGDDDPIRQAWRMVIGPGTTFLESRVQQLESDSAH